MLKKANKYIALSAVYMLTFSACSTDDALSIPDHQGKTPIELTAGFTGESPATHRAMTRSTVTSNATNAKPFAAGTSVYLVLKSEKNNAGAVYTRTIGYLQGNETSTSNAIHFASDYGRFWEDSYSRNSQLSAYAACVPGYYLEESVNETLEGTPNGKEDATTWTIAGSNQYDNVWDASNGVTTLAWPLREADVTNQDVNDFVNSQDLCFSNNVAKLNDEEDHRVVFTEAHKKFGSGNLIFYHALTRITFKIIKGEGFTDKDNFAFTEKDENIVLKEFNTSGTFDFIDGEFQGTAGTETIKKLAVTEDNRSTKGGYAYVLDGLMLPGTDLNDANTDLIYFTIDHNLYHMSKSMLMKALNDKTLNDHTTPALDNGKMRPGVHYVFTMSVGKKKMDNFMATVVEWDKVEADEMTPTNARITMTLRQDGTPKTGEAEFDLFRSSNVSETINDKYESYAWETGYTPADNKAQLKENVTNSGIYTAEEAQDPHTAWYWPDNKTFFHFRTVMPKTDDTWKVTEDKEGGDYITLAAGETYSDVCWGAPFVSTPDKLTYDYDANGFDGENDPTTHQLSMAIGPTTSAVNMIMFHMMSDVTINITTTDGTDKVNLTNAKMELSNVYSTGKVLMGNGLVVPTSTAETINHEETSSTNQISWHYGFIPQSLEDVVLTITTADNNQYVVNMKDVLATTVEDNIIANPYTKSNGKYVINRWLPNYKYTYKFKLTKAGITKISASLANWEEVEVDETVQIK